MRQCFSLRSLLVALAIGATLATPACSKKSSEGNAANTITAESLEESPESITEEHDSGTVTWNVSPDGQVSALAKTKDDKPVGKDVTGELTWTTPDGDKTIPVTVDEKTGLLVASGPKLEDDITEIKYKLNIEGKAWTGTMHLPKGGTKELAESAKEATENTPEKDQKGPNGGVIQVVGKDKIEIVADKKSGQVRVYVLGDELKPIEVGERKIKLAVTTANGPEVVVLTPEPKGLYFTGKLTVKAEPVKVTVAVTHHDETHVCLVGWHPGVHVVVGSHAPHVAIWVNAGWVVAPVVVVHDHPHVHWKGKGKGKGKIKIRGGGVNIHIH